MEKVALEGYAYFSETVGVMESSGENETIDECVTPERGIVHSQGSVSWRVINSSQSNDQHD